ncbi:recombinase family protein [Flagellimonas onchidii]|uniref:recombinase family protein n=1 Tax=Flagellimonas onchidii TaxID=2562684 RepID=UPI0010A6001B|nr:recombinase family protein [Allomuricauda onchidii]
MLGIYARISGEKEDDEDRSIDFQIEKGKEMAVELGLSYRTYTDEGVSGTTSPDEREGLSQLLLDIVSGDITHLYVWHQYRLYRSDEARMKVQTVCRRHKVEIYYDREKFNYDDPTAKLLDSIMSATGQFYVDLTKKHVAGVIEKNFKEGKVHGRMPFGYSKGSERELIPNPETEGIVKSIFEWSANGETAGAIRDRLNRMRIPPYFGGKWKKTSVLKVLHNPMYYGQRNFKGSHVPCPALIDRELFERSLATLEQNATTKGVHNPDRFYLNGLIRCNNCGNRYLGMQTKYPHYMCATKRDDPKKCTSTNINASFLDDLVWYVMLNNLQDLIERELSNQNGLDELKERLRNVQDEMDDLLKQEVRHGEMLISNALTLEALETISQRIKKDREKLTREIKVVSSQIQSYNKPDLSDLNFKGTVSLPNTVKRELAQKYIHEIGVFGIDKVRRIDIVFKYKRLALSYYIHTKKGFAVNRHYPELILTGKMLKQKFKKASDELRWWNNVPVIKEVNDKVLSDNFDVIEGEGFEIKLPDGSIQPTFMDYKPYFYYDSEPEPIYDHEARVTHLI